MDTFIAGVKIDVVKGTHVSLKRRSLIICQSECKYTLEQKVRGSTAAESN